MSENRFSEAITATRKYLDSSKGKAQWSENQIAHGFCYGLNMTAAIQSANPKLHVIRIEDIDRIAIAVNGKGVV